MSNSRIKLKRTQTPRRGDWYVLWPVWTLSAALVASLVFGFVQLYRAERPQKSDLEVTALGAKQDLHLDPGKLSPAHPQLFEISDAGQKVRFVVRRTQDKAIHVALASCKSCYRSKDSHYMLHGNMICGQCKQTMDFESKGEKAAKNNCLLPEIPHTEKGNDMTVLVRDVLAQANKTLQ